MCGKRFRCLGTEYLHIEGLLYRERARVILDYDNIMQDLDSSGCCHSFKIFIIQKLKGTGRSKELRENSETFKLIRQSLKLEKNWRTYGLGDFTLNIRTGAMIELIV